MTPSRRLYWTRTLAQLPARMELRFVTCTLYFSQCIANGFLLQANLDTSDAMDGTAESDDVLPSYIDVFSDLLRPVTECVIFLLLCCA
jgi:hypothetical protein